MSTSISSSRSVSSKIPCEADDEAKEEEEEEEEEEEYDDDDDDDTATWPLLICAVMHGSQLVI